MQKKRMVSVLMMMLMLCGCGNGGNADKENTLINEPEDMVSHDIVYEEKKFEPKEEILTAELGSGLIQIGDTVVCLPMKVSELTEKTNAVYYSIDYNPDITSNDFLVSEDDGAVIAGLQFLDANCTAVYYCSVPKVDACPAGDLRACELRSIVSENIILPKGVKVGMSLNEIKEIFGDELETRVSYVGVGNAHTEDTIEYKVRFDITEKQAIAGCDDYWQFNYLEDVPAEYVGILEIRINRSTGKVQELRITYGYDAATN